MSPSGEKNGWSDKETIHNSNIIMSFATNAFKLMITKHKKPIVGYTKYKCIYPKDHVQEINKDEKTTTTMTIASIINSSSSSSSNCNTNNDGIWEGGDLNRNSNLALPILRMLQVPSIILVSYSNIMVHMV